MKLNGDESRKRAAKEIFEEKEQIKKCICKQINDDVPQYLSVAEVAAIMNISPQQVRKNCSSRKYEGYQPSGPDGIWFVNSDTFRNDPSIDWNDFISKRNKLFAQSQEVAELALKLQDQNLEELGVDESKE